MIRAPLAPVDIASLPVRVKCPDLPESMYAGVEEGTRIYVGRIDARAFKALVKAAVARNRPSARR